MTILSSTSSAPPELAVAGKAMTLHFALQHEPPPVLPHPRPQRARRARLARATPRDPTPIWPNGMARRMTARSCIIFYKVVTRRHLEFGTWRALAPASAVNGPPPPSGHSTCPTARARPTAPGPMGHRVTDEAFAPPEPGIVRQLRPRQQRPADFITAPSTTSCIGRLYREKRVSGAITYPQVYCDGPRLGHLRPIRLASSTA